MRGGCLRPRAAWRPRYGRQGIFRDASVTLVVAVAMPVAVSLAVAVGVAVVVMAVPASVAVAVDDSSFVKDRFLATKQHNVD